MRSDLFSIEGKVAVVTGGSRGIGLMIAEGLIDAGVRVYISSRKVEACEEVAVKLSQKGECISVPADLSNAEGVAHLTAEVSQREERLHILVNNAGATWGAPFEEFPEKGFDKTLDVNLKGVFLLTQALLPKLRAAASAEDPARVINIGSVDGLRVPAPGMNNYAYSLSKAALHMFTRHLAADLGPEHIAVNAIAPGPFDSPMMAFVLDDPETRAEIAGSIPLRRIGHPDDMAGTTVFLCSRAGAYLNGAIISVDGGISARGWS